MPSRRFRPHFEQLESRDTPSTSPVLAVPARSTSWLDSHVQFVKLAHEGGINVLFLGDSITQRWLSVGRATWNRDFASLGTYDFGIMGDATQNLLWRVTHGELIGINPKVVVLMVGTNNLSTANAAQITAGISATTKAIHNALPSTKILLLGILPRGGPEDTALRTESAAINQRLTKLANGGSVRFLDASGLFLGSDGMPRLDLMPDQLHPSAAGYQALGQAIVPIVRAMLAPPPPPPAPTPAPAPAPHGTTPGPNITPNFQPTIAVNPAPNGFTTNWFDGNAASQIWNQMQISVM
jgi:lysophospholipase L1-like esterase